MDGQPDEVHGLERDGERQEGVPVLPGSFGADPEPSEGHIWAVVLEVPVQHQGLGSCNSWLNCLLLLLILQFDAG